MTSFQSSDDVSLFKAVKVIQIPFSDVTTESNSCPYNCSFVYTYILQPKNDHKKYIMSITCIWFNVIIYFWHLIIKISEVWKGVS